jgi:hypothetical protein
MNIYFIQLIDEPKLIKIGKSKNPEKRIKDIQRSLFSSVKTLCIIKETNAISEQSLHNKFNAIRHKGEWFYPEDKLLEFIESLSRHDSSKSGTDRAWQKLIKEEPRLIELETIAITEHLIAKSDKHYCKYRAWKERIEKDMEMLVGWGCNNPKINNSEWYDVAFYHIFEDTMPECRHKRIFC